MSSPFTFSNNLVEIGALAALLGSSSAESLVLGNRGTAGVAWAASSSFCAVSVVKGCVAGAVPAWLREILGLRSEASDAAVGFELAVNSKFARQAAYTQEAVVHYLDSARSTVVYRADGLLHSRLRQLPAVPPDSPFKVFSIDGSKRHAPDRPLLPYVVHFASLVKLSEVYILWSLGGKATALASAAPWAYYFALSLALGMRDYSLHAHPRHGRLDVVAGELPTPTAAGGARTVLLGASCDPRARLLWRTVWAVGAVVVATSLVASYISLSADPRRTVFVWAAFQAVWLVLRSVVYHILPLPTNATRPLFQWGFFLDSPTPTERERVLQLALGVARAQTLAHRRGETHYAADSFTLATLRLLCDRSVNADLYPLIPGTSPVRVVLHALIGDTVLSSVAWIGGSDILEPQLHDSCIVVFNCAGALLAVPSVRILRGTSIEPDPRGEPRWWYWVPCSAGRWLEFPVYGARARLGAVNAIVRTEADLGALLDSGALGLLRIRSMQDLWRSIEFSRLGRVEVLKLLSAD
ncbi:hypothetical protein MKEN_01448900 [Mycena kentingensis (nom. inval.)]|nr:hypothetical protein MKEN_01448900 [Mycena kentingensis (nom. inval.)]